MKIYNYTGSALLVGSEPIDLTELTVMRNTPVYCEGVQLDLTDLDIAVLYRDANGVTVQELAGYNQLLPWVLIFNAFGFVALAVKLVQKLKSGR